VKYPSIPRSSRCISATSGWLTSGPIAHRGLYDDTAGAPENSLPAFRRAADQGIPFELDVQLTSDGSLIVWHDAKVIFPDGTAAAVEAITTNDLNRVRLGRTDEWVPTLAQVLETVDGRVPIVLDVRRYRFARHAQFERAIADEIRNYLGPIALQSFDPLAVYRFHRLTQDRHGGQASGELPSANKLIAPIGRAMLTNVVTRPDFITYEITRLPSFWTNLWRRRGVPLLAFPIENERDEQRAIALANNYFFANYLPRRYQSGGSVQA
jgi:glycerophosphoryl diester phosphodiesterase